jgi:nucleoside-diphosphate-sugar epimerase
MGAPDSSSVRYYISDAIPSHQVKRVVITSSCASILEVHPEPTTFSEKDWNDQSWRIVQEKGREAENIDKYRASKILSEKGM